MHPRINTSIHLSFYASILLYVCASFLLAGGTERLHPQLSQYPTINSFAILAAKKPTNNVLKNANSLFLLLCVYTSAHLFYWWVVQVFACTTLTLAAARVRSRSPASRSRVLARHRCGFRTLTRHKQLCRLPLAFNFYWWVVQGSNLWPFACEANALPLS